MKDLLVTTHTPALRSGQARRTYGIARALAAGEGGLTLLYVRFGAEAPDEAFRAIPGIELVEIVPSRGLRRLGTYAGARLAGVPVGFARGVSPELRRAAEALADEKPQRRVIADGPIAAAALAALARRRPVIYNAHNLESGFRHELAHGAREQRGLRSFERRLLERASESWMVSATDMEAAHRLLPGARLRYVPNVVDVAAIVPQSAPPEGRRAIFVASFAYEPNRNGLQFLLGEVFPLVWEELPDARLSLAGGGLEGSPSGDPRVEALGFVEDLDAAYARARCAVVPLLQGGGTPLKFIEALAHGLPVIATPRAAQGLEVTDGWDCLIAPDAEAFAAGVIRVLRDGAPELGHNGRVLAAERYSIESLAGLINAT
jgi:glycosyltransferase involved in cell wall biosynthesis